MLFSWWCGFVLIEGTTGSLNRCGSRRGFSGYKRTAGTFERGRLLTGRDSFWLWFTGNWLVAHFFDGTTGVSSAAGRCWVCGSCGCRGRISSGSRYAGTGGSRCWSWLGVAGRSGTAWGSSGRVSRASGHGGASNRGGGDGSGCSRRAGAGAR